MSKKLSHVLLIGVGLFSSTWVMAAVKEYDLTIAEQTVNITGKPLKRITVNGKFVAPLLEFEEGDDAVIRVHNKLKNQDSSIHWHGLILPGIMDGVPGFNQFDGIAPNKTYEYKFKVRQNGTYWYHSHSKGQEQDGLYGPLVIYPKNKVPLTAGEKADRDYVVLLSDFHNSTSGQIMSNLKKEADYYQNRRETVFDVFKQIKRDGLKATWQDRSMWNQMRMLKTDMSDVTNYTFLMNGKTPEQNWTGNFKAGEKVRLRFINASAMSFFDVRIPNLKMTVVSADGQPVKPVPVDEFRIGTAETYDVIVEPKQANYQIEAESIDRSGFSVGTLHDENTTPVKNIVMPKPRPRSLLTMEDMGMDHDMSSMNGMDHDMSSMKSESKDQSMSGMDHDMSSMKGMDHDMSSMKSDSKEQSMPGMDHDMSSMKGMDHDMSSMKSDSKEQSMPGMDHDMSSMKGMDHDMSSMKSDSKDQSMSGMNHDMSAMNTNTSETSDVVYGWANASTPVGQRALKYSDLQSLNPQQDTRAPEREIEIRLGGNMERYIWTINGKKFNQTEPFKVKYGERIRLKFINDSMMAHPMHLHGMFMQLENGQDPSNMPNKHTVIVPPGKTVTTLLTADELGEWAIHCHLLYHMSAGMMNKLIVANVDSNGTDMKDVVAQPKTNDKGVNQHAHH
ncbi:MULTISPECIES: multicopper oxidase domain-containing protein [Acinetobacter calcoaceticus/baumannii complex]|uniref:Multicopper oxidase domain-containing protein n=2 Tax=Acinetobacter calcoaceticus/baumannii complex TaxID=909768 RepID=A0A7S8ZUI0_ACIBA|nr:MULTISPECIES: multicopper oxidase domain-containing protein [Acinetobacter calcoaceticus/baumannii complex]EHU1705200.1 multicopper oxidase domain-containing protein [Acinetobacter baumannii]EKT8678516.1 multicopper oxidase domain-containing protein [Acinetobacter baumannii]EKU0559446.1 multicopper oxidase domain-containing protein [Acinetobacter baumannii]EKU2508243.1 multicopper oxidase domain-containing protein [Acinetobacter baumannii]EKW2951736.1 multicopper oxidase domain-containing p